MRNKILFIDTEAFYFIFEELFGPYSVTVWPKRYEELYFGIFSDNTLLYGSFIEINIDFIFKDLSSSIFMLIIFGC